MHGLLLLQGICVPNVKFIDLQTAKIYSICLCCHGSKVSITTNHMSDCSCLKRSVYQIRTSYIYTSNSQVINACFCCHGNKVFMATSHTMDV